MLPSFHPSFHNKSTPGHSGANTMLFPSRSSDTTFRALHNTPVNMWLVKILNATLRVKNRSQGRRQFHHIAICQVKVAESQQQQMIWFKTPPVPLVMTYIPYARQWHHTAQLIVGVPSTREAKHIQMIHQPPPSRKESVGLLCGALGRISSLIPYNTGSLSPRFCSFSPVLAHTVVKLDTQKGISTNMYLSSVVKPQLPPPSMANTPLVTLSRRPGGVHYNQK